MVHLSPLLFQETPDAGFVLKYPGAGQGFLQTGGSRYNRLSIDFAPCNADLWCYNTIVFRKHKRLFQIVKSYFILFNQGQRKNRRTTTCLMPAG
jgi:hypothetical protein